MEEQLKAIVAGYLKTETSAIGNETVIDRSALGNSIVLHRLYASFSQQGYNVSNYNTIRTFGDLKTRLKNRNGTEKNVDNGITINTAGDKQTLTVNHASGTRGIGIDIEDVSFLEEATDYREHVFYRNNFTEREISYCLLQSNPKTSFTGLFAAKEAIVKAQNQFIGISFNELEIQHDKNGKPLFKNFDLSISHSGNLAVAVAVVSGQSMQDCKTVMKDVEALSPAGASSQKKFPILTILTLLFSLAAFALALVCYLKQ